jgi:very-short-patch-repair endonuclease
VRTFVDVELVVERFGVIATRDHPELRGAINRRVRNGRLVRVLPGVYSPPAAATELRQRVAAVPLWDLDAIITHEAAAALTFWPDIRVPVIRCAVKHAKAPQRGYTFVREHIPPELVWRHGPVLLTNPTLTALDLAADTDGGSIDRALLRRKTTLHLMREALVLTGRRRGNPDRRKLLLDSRDNPWSTAERRCHRLFREAGITGWKGNQPVMLEQQEFFVDIMFRRLRLVVEIDGREFHIGVEVFESDRRRQNLLVLHGWRVLRITWAMITDEPDQVVAMVREAMAQAA